MRRVAIWLGLAVAALGILAGLMPVRAGGDECGSAFAPDGLQSAACGDTRSLVWVPAVPLIVVGAAAAGGGALARLMKD